MHQTLNCATAGRGLTDITGEVNDLVGKSGTVNGLCTVFIQHTSASLLIQENADPDVLIDLENWFARHIPDGDPRYRHVDEGPDDMPAHIRGALTLTSITIPVIDGRLGLGRWQGLFLYEHRHAAHTRRLIITTQA